jgi:hypothetical protein
MNPSRQLPVNVGDVPDGPNEQDSSECLQVQGNGCLSVGASALDNMFRRHPMN